MSGGSKEPSQAEITESPNGSFDAASSEDDRSEQDVLETRSNENSTERELSSGPQAKTNETPSIHEDSSSGEDNPTTPSNKKPSLSRPSDFAALVPDSQERRDIINEAEIREVRASFQKATLCWVSAASHYIRTLTKLRDVQGNTSSAQNDPTDIDSLARDAGFLVRVPWGRRPKACEIKGSKVTDDQLRDELMDIIDARLLFMEKTEKLKRDIEAQKAKNTKAVDAQRKQQAVGTATGFPAQCITDRASSK